MPRKSIRKNLRKFRSKRRILKSKKSSRTRKSIKNKRLSRRKQRAGATEISYEQDTPGSIIDEISTQATKLNNQLFNLEDTILTKEQKNKQLTDEQLTDEQLNKLEDIHTRLIDLRTQILDFLKTHFLYEVLKGDEEYQLPEPEVKQNIISKIIYVSNRHIFDLLDKLNDHIKANDMSCENNRPLCNQLNQIHQFIKGFREKLKQYGIYEFKSKPRGRHREGASSGGVTNGRGATGRGGVTKTVNTYLKGVKAVVQKYE